MAKGSSRRASGRNQDRWVIAGVGATVLAVALVAYGVVVSSTRSDQAVTVSTYTPPPTLIRPTAAFLGDSYTSGSGASQGEGYSWQASQKMCWRQANFGEGSTGYTNPGPPEETGKSIYFDRVSEVVAAEPDLVIIQGSTNDYQEAEVYPEALRTFDALKSGLPGVPIFVVGPLAPPESVPALVSAARSALVRATADAGVPFIDPIAENWIPTDSGKWADGFHPDNVGHSDIAEALTADLTTLGAQPAC